MKIKSMVLKKDDNGNVVVQNGMPVYIIEYEDGNKKEEPYNASQALMKINELNGEAKNHRLAKEAAEKSLEEMTEKIGDMDVEEAKKALETIKDLDQSKLLGPEKVKELRTEITKELTGQFEKTFAAETKKITDEFEGKLKTANSSITEHQGTIAELLIKNEFHNSNWFVPMGENDPKTTLDPEFASKIFRDFFQVEGTGAEAKLIGYIDKEKIASLDPTKIGQTANFDEAIEQIFNSFPIEKRNQYLRASQGGPGSGDNFAESGAPGGVIKITRKEALNPETYDKVEKRANEIGATISVTE